MRNFAEKIEEASLFGASVVGIDLSLNTSRVTVTLVVPGGNRIQGKSDKNGDPHLALFRAISDAVAQLYGSQSDRF